MTKNYICPFCGSKLELVEGSKKKAYVCSSSVEHRFIESIESSTTAKGSKYYLLWTPTINVDDEEDIMYFRKYYQKTATLYVEVFDATTTENLLSLIQSQNVTISGLINEYGKLSKEYDELEKKYLLSNPTTPSGIILAR